MSEPAQRDCSACCGRGTYTGLPGTLYDCVLCKGTGKRLQSAYECRHFVPEWEDCALCIIEEQVDPLVARVAELEGLLHTAVVDRDLARRELENVTRVLNAWAEDAQKTRAQLLRIKKEAELRGYWSVLNAVGGK